MNLKANFKETDLFKVFQSGELALLDNENSEIGQRMPTLLAMRNELYSEKFRAIVSKITGCHDITARVDCSANAVSGFLACT
jgi:hypothetical protein